MSRRTVAPLMIASLILCLIAHDILAANGFASATFDQRWRQDEQVTPNFWGPLDLATDGITETYTEGTAGPICRADQVCPQYLVKGKRLVQYFDKGRMELTTPGAPVTSGLLVKEMISGRMQMGDTTFENHTPARISVAGDPDNLFPLYSDLTAPIPPQPLTAGASVQTELTPNGPQAAANIPPDTQAAIGVTDSITGIAIPRIFVDFREHVGLQVVGLAITQPFWVQVKVGGMQRYVLMQAFERRVLTYNAANPDPFKVEFGNVGQHYYRWRYGNR